MIALPPCLGGRYLVQDRLGQGAIAEVVRAEDLRDGGEVALKVLYPALRESPVVVERFRREVELVRRIQDPHVLRIQELAETDGYLYLVMDFHPGGDLADRVARRGPLPAPEVERLARQLCGALAAAHRAGVVHRDVKPSNVLVGAGVELDLRLCDFGLARSAEGSGLTTGAAVLGTPEYMAPEVIAEGHADPRSDLYSLGVVLFEAATGRLPLPADSPYQLMRLHLEVTPPRARTLAPELPEALDEAIARLLAKDPLDRYPSAEALARALAEPQPAVAAPAPLTSGRACPRCGGWLVERAAVCADCGETSLRLERQRRGGAAVLVTGPGALGHRLDSRRHVALYRMLDELPAAWAPRHSAAPRFPFYLARDLTGASAKRLLARVRELGLEGQVMKAPALAPPEMRRKALQLGNRSLTAAGAVWLLQLGNFLPRSWADGVQGAAYMGAILVVLGCFAVGARRALRPVLSPAAASPSLVGADARLGAALAALGSRQDRRLLARIAERLEQLPGTAPLASRAADLAEGLVALQRVDPQAAAAPLDAGPALTEVRRLERGRVLLRAELLRVVSRLDAAVAAAQRSRTAEAEAELGRHTADVEDLALTAEAERELEAFLRPLPAGAER